MPTLSEYDNPGAFDENSSCWMGYQLPNGRAHLTLSGVANVDYVGSSSTNWRRDTFTLDLNVDRAFRQLNLGPAPGYQHYVLHVEQWVVYASVNSVWNSKLNESLGFAVDGFSGSGPINGSSQLPGPIRVGHNPVSSTSPNDPSGDFREPLPVNIHVAVIDYDAELYRVAYHVTLIGRIATEGPNPPSPR